MKKIIFALFFGMGALHATQSGCGISLYYGNGVLQDKNEREAQKLWEIEVKNLKESIQSCQILYFWLKLRITLLT